MKTVVAQEDWLARDHLKLTRTTLDGIAWRTGPIWSPAVGLVGLVMFAGLLSIVVCVVTGQLLFTRVVRGRVLG